MITAWRICPARRVRGAFTGEGAFLHGGRWNSPGRAMVYAAGSQALAALEVLVHCDDPSALVDCHYVVVPVMFPSALVAEPPRLPARWWVYPAPSAAARLGDAWLAAGRSAVLRVPSAVVRDECNYLLNPAHPSFARVQVGKAKSFRFDSRLR